MYKYYNPNPLGRTNSGDCVVRALTKLFNQSWDTVYTNLCLSGLSMAMMPTSNAVSKAYMEQNGYVMGVPKECSDCITVREFAEDHPRGKYLLCMGDHVVALVDGDYYDSFDSGNEIVTYYFSKQERR